MGKIQFKYLWYVIASGFLSVAVVYLINVVNFKEASLFYEQHGHSVPYEFSFLFKYITTFIYGLIFVFIGLEIKNLKAGIAGAISFSALSILMPYVLKNQLTHPDWIPYFLLIPAILSVFIFSLFTKLSFPKKLLFTLFGTALFKGFSFIQSLLNLFSETVLGKIMKLELDRHNLLEIKISTGGESYRFWSASHILELMFSVPLIYIYIIFLFYFISRSNSFRQLQQVDPDFNLPRIKTIIIHFFSHFGIILVSSGIFYWVISKAYIKLQYYEDRLSPPYSVYFYAFVGIVCVLTFAVLYRNFMINFFLSRQKKIGWNYFFCNVLFIGVIVWIINVLVWKKPEQISHSKLMSVFNEDNTNLRFSFFGIYTLWFILRAASMINEKTFLILLAVDLAFFCLFIFYRYGLYILVIVKTLVFFALIYMEINGDLFDTKINTPVSANYFYAIAFMFLTYPAFFPDSFWISKTPEQKIPG